jgi:hypothetical protein
MWLMTRRRPVTVLNVIVKVNENAFFKNGVPVGGDSVEIKD